MGMRQTTKAARAEMQRNRPMSGKSLTHDILAVDLVVFDLVVVKFTHLPELNPFSLSVVHL